MEGDMFHADLRLLQLLYHLPGKVQSGRWCGHRTIVHAVDSLVTLPIAILCFPLQIRWDGSASRLFDDLSKGHPTLLPLKRNDKSVPAPLFQLCFKL